MSEAHRPWRQRLGAYALGHLDEAEAAAVRAHLDGCASCRDEAAELARVARVLPLADPERVASSPSPPPELADQILARVAQERRAERRRRRRRAGVRLVAGLAAAAVVATVLAVVVPAGPSGERVVFPGAPAGVRAEAELLARPWGTEIALEVGGLPGGSSFNVWLQEADGDRVPAGTFVAVRDRMLRMTLAAALRKEEAVALGISTPEGDTVLLAPLQG